MQVENILQLEQPWRCKYCPVKIYPTVYFTFEFDTELIERCVTDGDRNIVRAICPRNCKCSWIECSCSWRWITQPNQDDAAHPKPTWSVQWDTEMQTQEGIYVSEHMSWNLMYGTRSQCSSSRMVDEMWLYFDIVRVKERSQWLDMIGSGVVVRRTLTDKVAHSLVWALIHNRIYYCNGILASGPKYLTEKLVSASCCRQTRPTTAQLLARFRIDVRSTSLVERRVKFKLALLAYKSVHGLTPEYLSAYCVPVLRLPGCSHLWSADQWTMFIPRTKTVTIDPRGFYCSCPSVWNSLPVPLRDFNLSLETFRRKLKLHLFIS